MKGSNKRGDNGNIKENMTELAKRVGNYFSAEPQKEKVLSHEDFRGAGDTYYATVSASYKVVQRVLVVFLVFFIAISVITNAREITYENFYYLLKDFISASDAGSNSYETLSYESDSRQRFVLYRGGIASVSPSRLSIFTATGRRTLNETSGFSSPFAVSSGRYVLFYDTAGTTYSIYNSFARIHSEELLYPVKCASIAEDGSFAIVTMAESGYWTTRIYTKNFKLKATIPSSNYIFGISLSSEEEKLAVLSYGLGDGSGRATVSVYDLSKMKNSKGNEISLEKKLEFDREFPVMCGFTEKGIFAVITDTRVRTFDDQFDLMEESKDYSSGTMTGYSLNENGAAVSVISSSSNCVIAFDKNGSSIYDKNLYENISDISVYGEYLFLQTGQGVMSINTKNGDKQSLTCNHGKMLIYDERTALVCGESKAVYLVFEN